MNLKTHEGETSLMAAINSEQVESVEALLDFGSSMDAGDDQLGWGPLHLACSIGNLDIIEMLLRQKECNLNQLLGSGTPLHVAAGAGNVHAVQLLLQNGAEIDCLDDCGCTPLHCAAQHGYTAVLEVLLMAGADVNKQQNEGATSLYLATYFDQAEVVEMLISYGASLTEADYCGSLPTDVAKQNNNWYILKLLENAVKDITFV